MSESINTSPLKAIEESVDTNTRPVMVNVNHVSMIFNMASEQLNSLKEYAIAIAKRELMFKEFRALDDVSFTVHKGDVFGILGTNGSGKSTMLKIIAGVLEPTKGACSINGQIAPLIELGAGFDFELTARENIYLNGALLGYSRRFIDKHFDEIVEFAEVEKFLDMPMKNYSSGMVARIAFAIATVIVPDILIVDEVLSVGDFMFQQKCEQRIMDLIKEHDVTVLIVSHNNDQIERLCNKAIWIEKGHTRMIGDAHTVCNAYRVLGGHPGSAESEQIVYDMLNRDIKVTDLPIETIAGENRYGTAAKITTRCDFPLHKTVVLAPGDQPSLRFCGAGLAAAYECPILLIKPDTIPDATAQELRRLSPNRIIAIGLSKDGAIAIERELHDLCPAASITTSLQKTVQEAAISAYQIGVADNAWGSTAIVSWDGCFGDQMTLLPYCWANKTPMFYVEEDESLSAKLLDALKSGNFSSVLLLGGESTFSNTLINELARHHVDARRICANNPSEANATINEEFIFPLYANAGSNDKTFIVSSTWHPYDSFAAGCFAVQNQAAILLEDTKDLDSTAHAIDYILNQSGTIKRLFFIGDDIQFGHLDKQLLAKAASLKHQ